MYRVYTEHSNYYFCPSIESVPTASLDSLPPWSLTRVPASFCSSHSPILASVEHPDPCEMRLWSRPRNRTVKRLTNHGSGANDRPAKARRSAGGFHSRAAVERTRSQSTPRPPFFPWEFREGLDNRLLPTSQSSPHETLARLRSARDAGGPRCQDSTYLHPLVLSLP